VHIPQEALDDPSSLNAIASPWAWEPGPLVTVGARVEIFQRQVVGMFASEVRRWRSPSLAGSDAGAGLGRPNTKVQ